MGVQGCRVFHCEIYVSPSDLIVIFFFNSNVNNYLLILLIMTASVANTQQGCNVYLVNKAIIV